MCVHVCFFSFFFLFSLFLVKLFSIVYLFILLPFVVNKAYHSIITNAGCIATGVHGVGRSVASGCLFVCLSHINTCRIV